MKMTLTTMKPRDSRMAAVLLLLLTLLLGYFVLLHWWFVAPLRDIRAQMADLRDTQSRYAAAIAEKPALEKRLAQIGAGQAANNAFLPQADPNAATAGLMQRVVDVVAALPQGGQCDVTQKMPLPTAPPDQAEPYQKVAVSVSLRCDIEPLAAVLHALEQGLPYLFIDDLSVYRNPVTSREGGAAPLEVQFTLSGYLRPGAPETPGTPDQAGPDASAEVGP